MEKNQTGVVDMTLTWARALPVLLVLLKDGNEDGRKLAAEELKKMAIAADLYNQKKGS